MKVITSKNWKDTKKDKLIVDFFAQWCTPCKIVGATFALLEELYPDVDFAKCDVEEAEDIAKEYSIRNVPSLLFFKDGELVGRFAGAASKDKLKSFIEMHK